MKKKATVLEIKDGHAALLREDGVFVKSKNRNYKVGDVILMEEQSLWGRRKIFASLAAAMLITFLSSGMVAYASPSYYVSLDSNPSIVLEVNMFERVVKAEARDKEAIAVLEGLKLKNMSIEQAVGVTMERMSEMGYLQSSESKILVTATAKNQEKAEKLVAKLQKSVAEEITESHSEAQATVNIVGYDMVEAAKNIEGMTPGKYNIIANQLGKDPKDYVDVSIQDIMQEIKEAKEAKDNDIKEQPGHPEKPENLNKPAEPGKPSNPNKPEISPGKNP